MIGIAIDHAGTEIGEFLAFNRGTGVVWRNAPVFRREAESHRDIEVTKRIHLPVEPVERIWAEAVGP